MIHESFSAPLGEPLCWVCRIRLGGKDEDQAVKIVVVVAGMFIGAFSTQSDLTNIGAPEERPDRKSVV